MPLQPTLYPQTLPDWLRYIDSTFHEHLNEQNPDMFSLLKRLKEMERFLFLDCLVICDNNKLQTTVDRKWTHTDRLLDQSSCNPTLHKATTIKTLTRGVQLVCDSPDSLSDETRHLEHILQKKEKTITQTLSNSTLTETLNLTRQPTTQLLSQQ